MSKSDFKEERMLRKVLQKEFFIHKVFVMKSRDRKLNKKLRGMIREWNLTGELVS